MRLQRTALFLPEPSALHATLQPRLQAAQAVLLQIDTSKLLRKFSIHHGSRRPTRQSLPTVWHLLWHELSEPALKQAAENRFREGRTSSEQLVEAWLTPHLKEALAERDADLFLAAIENAGAQLNCTATGFRQGDVGLAAGKSGDRVMFLPATGITPQLRILHAYICANLLLHPLLTAVVGMIAITNCHPFADGNGRCSRVVFNSLLKIASLMRRGYLPLYELCWQCGCGYEIRVREAEITDNWMPVCEFMCDLLQLVGQLAPTKQHEAQIGVAAR